MAYNEGHMQKLLIYLDNDGCLPYKANINFLVASIP